MVRENAKYIIGAKLTTLKWVSNLSALSQHPPAQVERWMAHALQISPLLKACYQTVRLECVNEGWARPAPDEAKALSQAEEEAWVRSIVIYGDEVPCTFGRSVIPLATYTHFKDIFETLGSRFIGESFLHQSPGFERSAFEYRLCHLGDPQYPTHISGLEGPLWLRRSQFDCQGYPLLLTEGILPTIRDFPNAL